MEQQKQIPTQKHKIKEDGCDVKFKRDKLGRVVGFKATGKCTRDHLRLAQGSVEESYSGDDD